MHSRGLLNLTINFIVEKNIWAQGPSAKEAEESPWAEIFFVSSRNLYYEILKTQYGTLWNNILFYR